MNTPNPIHCHGCDGAHCTEPNGEIRRLPRGTGRWDGADLLCRACYDHEAREHGPKPPWEALKIYTNL